MIPIPPRLRASALALACLLIAPAILTAPAAAAPLPPIVIIPGAPGTELVDSKTGQRVWPSAWLMAYPMDGNDRLAAARSMIPRARRSSPANCCARSASGD